LDVPGGSLDMPQSVEMTQSVQVDGQQGSVWLHSLVLVLFAFQRDSESLSVFVLQVKVTVDEEGTTAAAVTSVVMVATSINLDFPEPLVFDRPFIFALVDDSTQSLLFLGTVKDPSKK
jgi:hypothetical protein